MCLNMKKYHTANSNMSFRICILVEKYLSLQHKFIHLCVVDSTSFVSCFVEYYNLLILLKTM